MPDISVPAYPSGQSSDPNAIYEAFHNMGKPSGDPNLINYDNWNGDYLGYVKYMAEHGDSAQYDMFMNAWLSEQSENRAREWTAQREDTQYQRLVQDLKAAGINPYILLNNGASPVSSSSSGNTYSGSHKANAAHNRQSEAKSWATLLVSLIGTIAFIASVAI